MSDFQFQQHRIHKSFFEELGNVLGRPDIATNEKRGIYLLFLLSNSDLLNTLISLITDCYDSDKGCFVVPIDKESEYRTLVLLRFGIIKKVDKIRFRYEFVDVNKFIQILSLILSNANFANILKIVNAPAVSILSARSINNFLSYLVNFIQPGSIKTKLGDIAIAKAVERFKFLGLLSDDENVVATQLATELVNLIVQIKDIYVVDSQVDSTNTLKGMEELKGLMTRIARLSPRDRRVDIEG